MTLREELITVSDAYGAAMKIGRQRVSTIVLQRGATLQRVADGDADVTTSTFERAMQWFSDNWPAEVDWPHGVSRPVPKAEDRADADVAEIAMTDRAPLSVSDDIRQL